MKRIFSLALAFFAAICYSASAEPVTLSWTFAGVESIQSKVILNNYPVLSAAGSDGGQWVLNSTVPSYARTSTTWITTGTAKTLRLGASNVSPAGTSLTLSDAANPIPANATINAVELLVKSVQTDSEWSLAVNGVKTAPTLVLSSSLEMDDCTPLRFENIGLTGNEICVTVESIATSGRYVYVAGIKVEYEGGGTVTEKVAAPTFNPASGAYVHKGDKITLSTATEGAIIYAATGSGAFVAMPDGSVTAEGAEGSTFSVRAYASKDGMADSDISSASYVIKAPAVEPPYTETFDNADILNSWVIVDADNDRSTWKYYSADKSVFIEHQIGNTGKNDWLISPALKLKAGNVYTLRFDVKAGNSHYPEKIAVALGTEPTAAAMTTEVLPAEKVDNADYRTITCRVTPAVSGDNYIGFHAVSDGGMFRLFIDNVRLSGGIAVSAPAGVENLVIENDKDGQPRATISFTAPSADVSGKALSSISTITVKRNGVVVKEFANPQPAAALTFTDEVERPGEYIYSVVAANDNGNGPDVEMPAFVGVNIPVGPRDVTLSEPAPGKVALSWAAPTATVYGDAINPAIVTYKIVNNTGTVLAENVSGTHWDAQVVEAGNQELMNFSVYAATAAGVNNDDFVSTEFLPIGTAYPLPYKESFTRWKASKVAEYITPDGCSGSWKVMRELIDAGILAKDADDGIIAFFPGFVGDKAIYRTGKIAVPADAQTTTLVFWLSNKKGSANSIEVSVSTADGTTKTTTITPDWDGWREQLVSLTDFAGKDVRISFTATAGTRDFVTALDVIEVKNIANRDLSAGRFRVPLEMDVMLPHKVTVEVVNTGIAAADNYSVELYNGSTKIDTQTGSALLRNESAIIEFIVTPGAEADASYSAKVVYGADDDFSNNDAAGIATTFVKPLYATVRELTAAAAGNDVELTWVAPSASDNSTAVTETFERYDEFGINTAGEWTFYDVDASPTYGINDGLHSFPNMGEPMAFIVFNGTIPTLDTIGSMTFGAHSGNQYLASFSIYGGELTNNDWLVSPRLNGKAQKVSFFARSMSIGAHEKFEFMYSTSGKDTHNFIKIAEGENYSGSWTEFAYDIPDGALYFAIRCVSRDQYAFFLDDITYIPAASEIESIAGYDIYRDGKKLNVTPVVATNFTDKDVEPGEHTYAVYAVMPRGTSEGVETKLEISGVENVAADSEAAEYYNLHGVRVNPDRDRLPAGIYIVRQGNTVRKVRF